MKVTRSIGRKLKFLVDVPTWVGWRELKFHAANVRDIVRLGFKPKLAERRESFEEAVERLKLSEADLERLMRSFFWTMCLYLAAATALFAYAVYLFLEGHVMAALLDVLIMCLALSFAFRESFFRFQVQQRRLGCTVRDWLNQFK